MYPGEILRHSTLAPVDLERGAAHSTPCDALHEDEGSGSIWGVQGLAL